MLKSGVELPEDPDELLAVVNFDAAAVSLVEPEQEAPGLLRYPTPAPEFVLWKLDPSDGVEVALPATDGGRVLLVVEGHVRDQAGTELRQGQAAFLEAGTAATASGTGTAFLAGASR